MEDPSQYGEVLGFFDRTDTLSSDTDLGGNPEPTTPLEEGENFDETMTQIQKNVEISTDPILEPDSTMITNMGNRKNIKLSILEVDSLHDLYTNYIGEIKPQENDSFNILMEKSKKILGRI